MRHPAAVDALVRWIVLTVAGASLLMVVPTDVFDPKPVAVLGGQPVTLGHGVGLAVIAVAWVWFLRRLAALRGPWCADAACRLFAVSTLVASIGVALAALWTDPAVLVVALVTGALVQVALAVRIDLVRLRLVRVLAPRQMAGVRP